MTARPEETADVVVIGGGLAGHVAALSAAEEGASVLLLEKEAELGGSTVLSGGFFAFAGTPLQRKHGVEDDPERLLADLQAVGGGYADERLQRAYSEGQAELFPWLTSKGIDFGDLELSSAQSVARSHRCDPREILRKLADSALATNRVSIRKGTKANRLLRKNEDAPVTGVEITTSDGRLERIIANRGVVMATGGFTRSDALLTSFAPAQSAALRIGGAGNTGDGLRMAWKLGADLRDMGFIKGTFGTHPSTTPDRPEILLAFYSGAIIVNLQGKRFVDESLPYKTIGDACLKQPRHLGFQILDAKVMARSQSGVPLFDFEPPLQRGLLLKADSLDELAQLCGIDDATALVSSVNAYNEGVRNGRDAQFGRDGLCNHAGDMITIDTPPFYAYPSTSVVLSTYCGVAIAPNAQVIDVFGAPIEGLFAAGEVTGGFHGENYMTGTGLGKAAYFGREAGRSAARRVERQTTETAGE